MRRANTVNAKRERGAVLVVSLIFLLVIMVLTTSMFRDVGLQEVMSGNQRAKLRAHHVANSALREQWVKLLELDVGEQATDARSRDFDTLYDQDLDGDPMTHEVDLQVSVNVCFEGATMAPGTDTDFSAYKFVLQSTAADQADAVSRLRQGGYIVAPKSPTPLPITCP